jgi:hypothetical protein
MGGFEVLDEFLHFEDLNLLVHVLFGSHDGELLNVVVGIAMLFEADLVFVGCTREAIKGLRLWSDGWLCV